MEQLPSDKTIRVLNKPSLNNGIELKSIEDLQKLISIGNLACLFEDEIEKYYFIHNFFYKIQK